MRNGRTPLEKCENRYHDDPAFHQAVTVFEAMILEMQMTPYEVREAALYACVRSEARRTTSFTVTLPREPDFRAAQPNGDTGPKETP